MQAVRALATAARTQLLLSGADTTVHEALELAPSKYRDEIGI